EVRHRAQVDVHRSGSRNDVDRLAAFDASDVVSRARILRRAIIGQPRDNSAQRVNWVNHAEITPTVTARPFERHAVAARPQGLMGKEPARGPADGNEGRGAPRQSPFAEQMSRASQVAFPLFADGGHEGYRAAQPDLG